MNSFTLSCYSDTAYVDDNNHFQAPSDILGKNPLKLFYFGNKNKDGLAIETELFNNSTLIENYATTLPQVITLTIDVYMLSNQLLHLEGSTCFMPLKFNFEGP